MAINITQPSSTSGSETAAGIVEFATATEAAAGSASLLAVQPSGLLIGGTLPSGATAGSIKALREPSGSVPGNARGAGAVDFQTERTAANQVASGISSFIGSGLNNMAAGGVSTIAGGMSNVCLGDFAVSLGGVANTSSGGFSTTCGGNTTLASGNASIVAGGWVSRSTGPYAFSTGLYALSDRHAQFSHSSGGFGGGVGSGQAIRLMFKQLTTNATPTRMDIDQGGGGFAVTLTKMVSGTLQITALQSTGAKACHFTRKFSIKNIAGTTSLVGAVSTVGTDVTDDAGLTVAITANNTTDQLDVTVTGIAGETYRWLGLLDAVELEMGSTF